MSTPNVHPPAAIRHAPRRVRIGGFVMSLETAAAWANRICGKEYHPTDNFYSVREVWPDDVNYIVMTQAARFDGYRGIDPTLIPQFEEGERAAIARPLLAEGVVDYEFKTLLR